MTDRSRNLSVMNLVMGSIEVVLSLFLLTLDNMVKSLFSCKIQGNTASDFFLFEQFVVCQISQLDIKIVRIHSQRPG